MNKLTQYRRVRRISQVVSKLCSPSLFSLLGVILLCISPVGQMFPYGVKLRLCGLVFLMTIVLPALFYFIAWLIDKKNKSLGEGNKTLNELFVFQFWFFPVIICTIILRNMHYPSLFVFPLYIQIAVMLFTKVLKYKLNLSLHLSMMGAFVYSSVACCFSLYYNPALWLSVLILVTGGLGTARIILRYHTVSQILGSFALGLLCAALMIYVYLP